jgi:hydrogenase-1 operon protein HyaE
MTFPVLDPLVARAALPWVDQAGLDAFLLGAPGESPHALLFFSGAAAPRPETSDVAAVLPEILCAFAGRLRGAIVAPEAEAALKGRFQVYVTPSLCVVRAGEPIAVLPKILDWADYLERIEAALAPQAPVLNEAKGPKTVFTFSKGADR